MRLTSGIGLFAFAAFVGTAIFPTGCSSSTSSSSSTSTDGGADGESATKPDELDVSNQPPHAQVTVALVESHPPTGTDVYGSVAIAAVPDTSAAKACSSTIGGCRYFAAPKCDATCKTGEYCAYDADCKSSCVKACTKSCDDDEVCYFPSAGANAQCRKKDAFDTGVVAFSGTTVPISLAPPYSYSMGEGGKGSLYLSGAKITVQASGAKEAGFDAWTHEMTATKFLQTSPALDTLKVGTVYGSSALPVSWIAGEDRVTITVASVGGSAVCVADDKTGRFEIPRSVLNAVLDGTSATLNVSVQRERHTITKGKKTKGTVNGKAVQSDGWVDLMTVSSESTSIQGCAGTATLCDGDCVDTRTDRTNCGACGVTCKNGATCSKGACVGGTGGSSGSGGIGGASGSSGSGGIGGSSGSGGIGGSSGSSGSGGFGGSSGSSGTGGTSGVTCQSCQQTASTGVCKISYDAASTDPNIQVLLDCIDPCTTQTCVDTCKNANPTTYDKYVTFLNCLCLDGCETECRTECGN